MDWLGPLIDDSGLVCLLGCKKNVDEHASYMLIYRVFLSKLHHEHNKVGIKEYQLKYTMLPQKKKIFNVQYDPFLWAHNIVFLIFVS